MTEGPIVKQMVAFAVPLFIGNLFQQMYNTADALIVGRFLGNDALAAVASTGTLIYLMIGFFEGVSAGAGVVISRYFGARDEEELHRAVHTHVTFGLSVGLLLSVVGTLLCPVILRWMGTPEDVLPLSTEYIKTFFSGSMFLVMYNNLRGLMQAVGDSRDPLKYLVISSITNVCLDLLFIGVFKTGVGGAAFATVLSQMLSVILCLRKLMTTKEVYRISPKELGFDPKILKLMISYGVPSGIQNSVIGFANVIVQSNINAFGKMAVAGCGAYSKIEGFAFLPINSFTIALTTFVGQNLGAREYDRAKKGARFGIICTPLIAESIGILTAVFAPYLIAAFTREPEAIAFGVEKARTCSLFFFLLAASHCLAAVLRGAGKAVVPMISMLSFWCVIRVAFLKIMVPIYNDIAVVNWVYPLTWLLSTVFLMVYYLKADWVHNFEKNA